MPPEPPSLLKRSASSLAALRSASPGECRFPFSEDEDEPVPVRRQVQILSLDDGSRTRGTDAEEGGGWSPKSSRVTGGLLLTGQALDDTDLADFHAKRERASSAPAHSGRSVLLAGKEGSLAGFTLVENSADVVRRRSASFRRKAPPPDFVGAAALPRVSKRCGYSDEAVAAIKTHEEFVRAARQLDALTVGARGGGDGGRGGGGGSGGGDGGSGGGGGERPRSVTPSKGAFISWVTRTPISAEGVAAAAAAAASGGGMWAGMAEGVRGPPCHWSRRPDTLEEDHERERAARMHLLRGDELQSAVQAIFSTSSSRPSSPSNLPPSTSPPSSSPPPTSSPERMQVSPNSRGKAWTPGAEIGAQTRRYLGAPGSEPGHQASRHARPTQALHSSVSEVLDKFQRESPANIPPSALPFAMRPPVPGVETGRGGGERRASPARTRVNSSPGSPEDLMTFGDFCGGGGGGLGLSVGSDAQTPTGTTVSKRGGGGGGGGVMTEQKAATLTLIKTLSKREQKVAKTKN
jgi:hypothetical protein